MGNYLSLDVGLAGRADLAWSMAEYIGSRPIVGGSKLGDHIVARWIQFGEYCVSRYLLCCGHCEPKTLRGQAIVIGETAIDEVFGQNPWVAARLVTNAPSSKTTSNKRDVYVRCEQVTEDEWFGGIPAVNDSVDRDLVRMVTSLAKAIPANMLYLKSYFPIAVSECWSEKERMILTSDVRCLLGEMFTDDEVVRNATRIVKSGNIIGRPEQAQEQSNHFYLALCHCMRQICAKALASRHARALWLFGLLLGLTTDEVYYLLLLSEKNRFVANGVIK